MSFFPRGGGEEKCENCGSDDFEDTRDGDLVCRGCGVIQKERQIDITLENRVFEEDDENEAVRVERIGTLADPNALASTGMAKMAPGVKSKANMGALHRAAAATQDKREQRLVDMSHRLKEITDTIELNDAVHKEAFKIFRDYDEKQNYKDVDEVLLAVIYIACRLLPDHGLLQYSDLVKYANKPMTASQISGRVDLIKTALKLRLDVSTATAPNLVMRFGNALGMQFAVRQLAKDIAVLMSNESVLQGKNPKTTAGVALWMASRLVGGTDSIADIAKSCEVAAATLKKGWTETFDERARVVPPEYTQNALGLPDKML